LVGNPTKWKNICDLQNATIEYVYDQNILNMEKLGPQLRQLSQNLIDKYPVLISQNTIDNALEESYDGIRKILRKAAKMRKTYPTRPTWWSDNN
jgi:hypothetical protein